MVSRLHTRIWITKLDIFLSEQASRIPASTTYLGPFLASGVLFDLCNTRVGSSSKSPASIAMLSDLDVYVALTPHRYRTAL